MPGAKKGQKQGRRPPKVAKNGAKVGACWGKVRRSAQSESPQKSVFLFSNF